MAWIIVATSSTLSFRTIIMILYVDDMLTADHKWGKSSGIKKQLANEFEMKNWELQRNYVALVLSETKLHDRYNCHKRNTLGRHRRSSVWRMLRLWAYHSVHISNSARNNHSSEMNDKGSIYVNSWQFDECNGVIKSRYCSSSWGCQSIYGKSCKRKLGSDQVAITLFQGNL